ncbi:FAD-dependent oxidoreductase, partial [Streptomyces sp. NPDC094032]|uniref:NAD(P)/FAD-dependent oxidoreductase n=1 Tax=Streptomyces sp. NPDC094032 TaxID=3155308 RepID=UPI003317F0FD
MRTRIVVIGAGTAGTRLAQRLPVTLLTEERHAPYNRVLLADVLAGRYAPEVITLPTPQTPPRLGIQALRIDRESRTVTCADGSRTPYDRLVLATGSAPLLPPLRGLRDTTPLAGVHPFRTLDDCLALQTHARPGTRAVVIGGGLLGVSASRALAALGAEVTLLHQGEYLMEGHLDRESAPLLTHHLSALGIEVHTECRVTGLRGHQGAVKAVALADNYILDTHLVVLACGVRPRVTLAREAGLEVNRGIVVDDELRTSDPYIHAIGDCAEHRGQVYGLATPALDQADVLADILDTEATNDPHTATARRGPERGWGCPDVAAPGTSEAKWRSQSGH